MSSSDLWEPWLVQIRGGGSQSLLEELKKAKILEFLGKTYMNAYIAATACKCACGTWTGHFNLLALRPMCEPCFTQWSRTNLMVKSKVCAEVYGTTPRPGLMLTPLPLPPSQTTHRPSRSISSPAGSLTQSRPCLIPNWGLKGRSLPSRSLSVPTPSALLLNATRMGWRDSRQTVRRASRRPATGVRRCLRIMRSAWRRRPRYVGRWVSVVAFLRENCPCIHITTPAPPSSLPPSRPSSQAGKKKPKYPKTSTILGSSVNEQDQGMAVDWFHGIVMPFFGYRRKNAPTRPISTELLTVTQHFVCIRCSPNRNRDVQYKIPTVRRRRDTGGSNTDWRWRLRKVRFTRKYSSQPHISIIHIQYPTHSALIQHAITAHS